ncbi:glycosyltransferase family 2 protein [Turneriella parva]|uniref:Glycosyl transferase family 2 n=1 Tax=Turneriella parva (strain ATCC BAA-1111 / DSM 21527 / NCTC 11395 / H) TaxID=869212 RepID=I4BAU6_TURPD|nr:glycosyltransferase family 2 protein [Turneriella parva]AFM14403.1 glycosyl transferase family 2 [Turneriella parva DSM 21527]
MIAAVIPVLNEEKSIGLVAKDLLATAKREKLKIQIIVCDNGSTDKTAVVAKKAGCLVVTEPARGYGSACLRALQEVPAAAKVVLFIDGDYSDFPEEFPHLVGPILTGAADLVIGSRTLAGAVRDRGSLTPQQRFGNWLATFLIRLFFRQRYSDLGPFRAISRSALQALNMQDRNFGWTVEMQIRAVRKNLRIAEVPVSYRRRIGVSKISGTIKGSVLAGYIILKTIFKEFLRKAC